MTTEMKVRLLNLQVYVSNICFQVICFQVICFQVICFQVCLLVIEGLCSSVRSSITQSSWALIIVPIMSLPFSLKCLHVSDKEYTSAGFKNIAICPSTSVLGQITVIVHFRRHSSQTGRPTLPCHDSNKRFIIR